MIIILCCNVCFSPHGLVLFLSLSVSLPPTFFCLHSATFSTRQPAFGFFHLWQITVKLLYNNFLPLLAPVLKTAKAELVASPFSPLGLELQELQKERKEGRRYVKCLLLRNYFDCFSAVYTAENKRGQEGTTCLAETMRERKGGGSKSSYFCSVKTFCWFWRALCFEWG